ncbi:hypothetical protein EW026_g6373 [Hermanssonia centrifuga]|uniref:WD repeat-containing protein JIP5 n=1 Tax=Hermanssonia centrifuga TaxID=98765 RepID=A0A4S4KD03_9APHY|nr:hypothetical protein EW026_g6373 [Hermanssonia centrifuga]
MLATGDDDGVVKLWDPRKAEPLREYTQHFDFISDFLWLEDKKHLVCTSGDGTLSVIDVRSKKTEPFAQSEDQEDELLSVVSIKGSQKLVVGTQLGILSIFNRRSGYGDCVDRIPGHPYSIDALCNIPSHYPNSHSTILTGSSDGMLRVVQLLPTKLLGVVADHGEFPIERIAVDRGGEGRWVGSAGHEEVLKLTDLKEVFEDEGDEEEEEQEEDSDDENAASTEVNDEDAQKAQSSDEEEEKEERNASDGEGGKEAKAEAESSDDEGAVERKRKKKDKDPFQITKKSKGRNGLEAEPSFFADL